MENAMNTDNFSLLIPKDTVKFVVSSISDLDKARKICIQYKVAEHCPIFLSPVFGRIEPKEIVEYMIEHHWNAQVYLAAGTARSIKGGKKTWL